MLVIRCSLLRGLLRRLAREEGQALLLAAAGMVGILGAAGLAIDGGYATWQYALAQNAADAAALAGAQDIPGSPSTPTSAQTASAISDATTYASDNGFTTGGAVTVTVNVPPTKGSHAGVETWVEVIITKQVPTFLLGVLKQNEITVSARAVATDPSGLSGATKCALCVLSPTASGALDVTGNGSVTVSGGGIVVDSDSSTAGILTGNGGVSDTDSLISTRIGVVGPGTNQKCTNVTGNGSFSPSPNCGVTTVSDPLSSVLAPSVSGSNQGPVSLSGNTSKTINPGIYTSLSVSANGSLTLNPGVYVLTGGSSALSMTGNGNITGNGVLIYFTCSSYSSTNTSPCSSSGQQGAGASLTGNGSYTVSAPTSSTCASVSSTCSYEGLSFFYDRNNTSPLSLTGNGNDSFTGTIYAKSAAATLTGNGGTDQLNSLLIANTVNLTGNGSINLSFNQSQNYQISAQAGSSTLEYDGSQ